MPLSGSVLHAQSRVFEGAHADPPSTGGGLSGLPQVAADPVRTRLNYSLWTFPPTLTVKNAEPLTDLGDVNFCQQERVVAVIE